MRVLVACEFSGVVRDAFARLGHDAHSCDLLPSERPGLHYEGDVRALLDGDWDLMVAHPPCTYLARCGARWWPGRERDQEAALDFVRLLLAAPIERICVENPPGRIGTAIRPADQYVQPWQFGHGERKMTGFWLKNLPPLHPTHTEEPLFGTEGVKGREARVHRMRPGPNRWRERSRTYEGIAAAMAEQWGVLEPVSPPPRVAGAEREGA